MPHRRVIRAIGRNLAVVALLLAALASFASLYFNGQRAQDNRDRINDIQADRVSSCERTYEAQREVFHIFFRPKVLRTRHEQHQIDQFNQQIDDLKAKCDIQTGVNQP